MCVLGWLGVSVAVACLCVPRGLRLLGWGSKGGARLGRRSAVCFVRRFVRCFIRRFVRRFVRCADGCGWLLR